ncbi:MAG: proliferating cell nuclear antigen (pcna) [Candidatus Altiarchaeales archaeon HGW-Altiarchaeales-1]|nr:MAG: proliferating cell nuclear antigen (pcna) [Candidatus Altiarchaeales archaeon HGW-Altiarchaeales-1]
MFTAKTSKVKDLKRAIESVSVLVDEGTLNISSKGIDIKVIDPSQIAMGILNIPKTMFEDYTLEGDKDLVVGMNFLELSKLMKRARSDDTVELKIDSKIGIKFKGKTTRDYELGILETSTPSREPKIETVDEIKIAGNLFADHVKDIEMVSSKIAVEFNSKGVVLSAEGDVTEVTIEISDENLIEKNVKEDAKATFSIEYLKNLITAADADTIISLKLKTNSPMVLEYSIGDGNVKYYLAPRIEGV